MEVEIKKSSGEVLFSCVPIGGVFYFAGLEAYYIKTGHTTAYRLRDNASGCGFSDPNTKVKLVRNAKIVGEMD